MRVGPDAQHAVATSLALQLVQTASPTVTTGDVSGRSALKTSGAQHKSALVAQVRELVRSARRSGYRKSELIAMIEAVH